MKYILMSGSFKNMEIYDEIIKFINKYFINKEICFITANFDDYDGNDKYSAKIINLFKNKGVEFESIKVVDNRLKKESMIASIKSSNLLFILGGDTLKQIKCINEYNLKKYIKNENKIIIGMSAGAINMAEKVVLAKDEDDNIPDLSIYDGLGISDINIEPHCNFNDTKHWKELEKASNISEIYVMDDNCYIIAENGHKYYYGTYLKLIKSKIIYNNKECTLIEFLRQVNYE